MTEIWTTDEVAAHCGIARSAVRSTMRRRGVPVYDRAPGQAGANRYAADAVRAAHAAAPGRGNRTSRRTAASPATEK